MARNNHTSRRTGSSRTLRSAAVLIRRTRRYAATMFNRGLRDSAAGLYEAAARALLSGGQKLPAASRRDLLVALREARVLSTPAARAWRLSTALDHVAASLRGRSTPALAVARAHTEVMHRRNRR